MKRVALVTSTNLPAEKHGMNTGLESRGRDSSQTLRPEQTIRPTAGDTRVLSKPQPQSIMDAMETSSDPGQSQPQVHEVITRAHANSEPPAPNATIKSPTRPESPKAPLAEETSSIDSSSLTEVNPSIAEVCNLPEHFISSFRKI